MSSRGRFETALEVALVNHLPIVKELPEGIFSNLLHVISEATYDIAFQHGKGCTDAELEETLEKTRQDNYLARNLALAANAFEESDGDDTTYENFKQAHKEWKEAYLNGLNT